MWLLSPFHKNAKSGDSHAGVLLCEPGKVSKGHCIKGPCPAPESGLSHAVQTCVEGDRGLASAGFSLPKSAQPTFFSQRPEKARWETKDQGDRCENKRQPAWRGVQLNRANTG